MIQLALTKNKITSFLFRVFFFTFCSVNIFFIKNISAATSNIIPENQIDESNIYNEDYYNLDYEPTNSKESDIWDPFKKVNRKTYKFNEYLLKHVAKPFYYNVYTKVTTAGMRRGIHNFSSNIKMPLVFANYVLQLDFDNSARALYSFVLNSTYGVLGIFDVSSHQDISVSKTNLDITFAKYNIPAGPYIVLPFFGSSDLRGAVSLISETLVDPFSSNILEIGGKKELLNDEVMIIKNSFVILDNISFIMENFYDLMESSFDPYVVMKDAYSQSQSYKVNNVKGK